MKKYLPGEFEYYNDQRMKQIIKTVILFAVPLALFIAGFVTTKTQKNLLTIVAVLGLLPACKSAVEMIMYLRYKGCDKAFQEEIRGYLKGLRHSYGMVFTTSENGTYEVPSIAVRNNCICGICFNKKAKIDLLEKHISVIMKQNGYTSVVVKIFDSKQAYFTRLKQLQSVESDNDKLDEAQRMLLHKISL